MEYLEINYNEPENQFEFKVIGYLEWKEVNYLIKHRWIYCTLKGIWTNDYNKDRMNDLKELWPSLFLHTLKGFKE